MPRLFDTTALAEGEPLGLARITREALRRWRGIPNLPKLRRQGMKVGTGVYISNGVYFDADFPWLIEIGNDVAFGRDAVVLTHDSSMRRAVGGTEIARVVIEDRAFIGWRAILLPGVTVGHDSIVGAGAVVSIDVPPATYVAGAPAVVVSSAHDFLEPHRKGLEVAPCWPHSDSSLETTTLEEKAAMRDLLAEGRSGYVGPFATQRNTHL